MFVGHYGVSFAATAARPRVKLWHGFVAVQLLDFAWGVFVLLGLEHVRIVPGFTQANALDLYDMPYTHSLVGALAWAVGAGLLYGLLRRRAGLTGAVVIGLLVFSHWILDVIVHTPDLALWPGSGIKVGLGLWRDIRVSLPLEIGTLAVGFAAYMHFTQAKGRVGMIWPWVFLVLLIALQVYGNFGPPPPDPQGAAEMALAAYIVLALGAAVLDVTRVAKA